MTFALTAWTWVALLAVACAAIGWRWLAAESELVVLRGQIDSLRTPPEADDPASIALRVRQQLVDEAIAEDRAADAKERDALPPAIARRMRRTTPTNPRDSTASGDFDCAGK